jgi:hypothetical protein
MEGFEEYREAARRGIIAVGAEPCLVEDYPGLVISPRSACLDGVVSCDVYLAIIGERGGWTTPSGKLVVEEEYEEALKAKLNVLVFVQNSHRDPDAQRFVDKISDYVDGVFRPTFDSPTDLKIAVEKALEPLIQHYGKPEIGLSMVQETVGNPHKVNNETSLRFVLAPERSGDLIDPVSLESPELKEQLYQIGHSSGVSLFSYERAKRMEIGINEIVILQSDEGIRSRGVDEVRLELDTRGMITIDTNVTGRKDADGWDDHGFVILEDDIAIELTHCFSFACAFFSKRDPYKRYDRMLFNSSLGGIGNRTLMTEPSKNGHYTVGQHGDEAILAFERPRLITRKDLEKPENEIDAVLALFRRRLKSQNQF